MNVPVTIAAPVAAATLAYLNARWRLPEDRRLLGSIALATRHFNKRLKADRVNPFYILEDHSNNPKIADKPFIVYCGKTWTFKQTYGMALRYAGWLHSTHNVVQVSLSDIGGVVTGSHPSIDNLVGTPFVHSIRTSGARLLIIDPEIEAKVLTPDTLTSVTSPTFRNNAFPLEIGVLNTGLQSSLEYFPQYRAPDSARAGAIGRSRCGLISTSGTTGLPKQAIIPFERTAVASEAVGRWMGLRPVTHSKSDRYYTAMPLYHSSAFQLGFHMCMYRGVTLVLGHKFSVSNFWTDVADGRATVVQYVGETLRYLLAAPPHPSDKTAHSVRMAFGNGLRPDVWDKFRARFGIPVVAEFYGATEGTTGTFNFSRNTFASGAIGSPGALSQILSNLSSAIVLVDWTTESPARSPTTGFCTRIAPNHPGELICALPADDIDSRFQGYHNNPSATESKILRDVFTKGDAYFRTGDVIRSDAEGRLWFVDRIGDTFRWKSENVSTNEVAEVLGSHPAVLDANVYGVSVPGHEGRAGCVALLLQASALDEKTGQPKGDVLEGLATWSVNSLPKYAVPVFIRVVKEIVATGNNKQQKTILRNEGVDPGAVKEDKLYWLRPGRGRYEIFGQAEYAMLGVGKVKL